jgi:hypothetical protein
MNCFNDMAGTSPAMTIPCERIAYRAAGPWMT